MALALLATGLRAEVPAGLDAQGVDPWAAVENKWGLDVRDAQGRPVTREQVLADLKGAAVQRAADNAFTSSLPKARVVLAALELLNDFADAFRMAANGFPLAKILPVLPGGRPKVEVLWLLIFACGAMTAVICRRPQARLSLSRSRQSSIEILRC